MAVSQLGPVSVRECFELGDLRPSIAGKGWSVFASGGYEIARADDF